MGEATQRRVLVAAIVFAYLYPFPYFAKIRSANELPRVYLTAAMVTEGRFAIDTGVAKHGRTVDVSPSGGHYYSNKAPGSSMLAIPGYVIARVFSGGEPSLATAVWVSRLTTGVIPTLLFLLLLWRFLGRYSESDDARRAILIAYALGSMAMTYSLLFIAHQLSAVCMGTALILIVRCTDEGDPLPKQWLAAAGFAAGAAVLCDYQAAFAGVPLLAFFVWRVWRSPKRDLRGVALAAAGAAVPIAILLAYHWMAFGHPLRTGYHASETFAHFHQRGFLGLDKFRVEAFVGSTIAPDNGLLFLAPFLLLSIIGWGLRGWPRDVRLLTAGTCVLYILFVSSIAFWRGGWQMGPRYITVMLPFAMVPAVVAMARAEARWATRGVAWGLILTSVLIYALSCSQFPHFPEKFKNPFFELTLALYADGHAPYSAGWALGLRGLAAQIPFLLAVAAALAVGLLPSRQKWRSALVAVIVCAAILAIYSTFDGGGATAAKAYEFVKSTYPK